MKFHIIFVFALLAVIAFNACQTAPNPRWKGLRKIGHGLKKVEHFGKKVLHGAQEVIPVVVAGSQIAGK